MERIIIEVGSTNTKIDIFDGNEVKRLDEITILFKNNYKKEGCISIFDKETLENKVIELGEKYKDIYVCGTSIFRDLKEQEKNSFLTEFKNKTGYEFHIITPEKENELTVRGSTRFVTSKACVFVGGGGSTEISMFDRIITESKNSPIGVMDVMDAFPDLAEDIASSSLESVMDFIRERLIIPEDTADILILSGGGHELFARESGILYEENFLYKDDTSKIMMDIETRRRETKRYFEEISLNEIRSRVSNPDWWFATRAMCAFVLVVAEKIKAKYIIPTNISMVYGILEEN